MDNQIREVKELTALLRSNTDFVIWQTIRDFLQSKQIDPQTTYLVWSTEEDEGNEYEVIVTVDRKVYKYFLRLSKDDSQIEQVYEWTNITDNYTTYESFVKAALQLLEDSDEAKL